MRKSFAACAGIGLLLPRLIVAAESWGGSLEATSDYLVRGISRSNHGAALQGDLHVATDSGLIGGIAASSVQFDSGDSRNAEVSAFAGFSWQPGGPWRAKVLASYYGYLWNDSGSQYNYAELSVEGAYDEWLDINLVYSPDAPRYVTSKGLAGVSSKSAEINVRTPWRHRLAAMAGIGFSELGGPDGRGYAYWSAGGVADFKPWSISLFYVNTDVNARKLFYSAAAQDRWAAAVIWRF